jgi:hypothetical protein
MTRNGVLRPTAELAKFHPWMIKRCQAAREYARFKSDTLSFKSADTSSVCDSSVDEEGVNIAELKKTLSSIEDSDLEPAEEVNLAQDVWEDSKFDPRKKWKKAVNVLVTIQRVQSTVKKPSEAEGLDQQNEILPEGVNVISVERRPSKTSNRHSLISPVLSRVSSYSRRSSGHT